MTCVVPAKIDTLNGEIRSTEMTDLYKMDKTYIAESFVRAGINDPCVPQLVPQQRVVAARSVRPYHYTRVQSETASCERGGP